MYVIKTLRITNTSTPQHLKPRAIHPSPAGRAEPSVPFPALSLVPPRLSPLSLPGPLPVPPRLSPVPFPCRVRREELPRGAQLSGPVQRRARHPALGLRVRGAEMLRLLAALRARPPLAPHQREAAGGARQDQSGRCERGCRAAEGLCGSAGG